jgi:hypothetical protein
LGKEVRPGINLHVRRKRGKPGYRVSWSGRKNGSSQKDRWATGKKGKRKKIEKIK